jgi:hypothetical protein
METRLMPIQPKLLAITGPLRGRIFEFNEDDDISIGRGEDSTIFIDHKSVSRRHCVFHKQGETFKVEDSGSRNGTFVNDEPVEARVLSHGDRIMAGNSSFVFLLQDEDVSSLLSDVRLTDGAFDSTASVELRREDTMYLHPEEALAGADARLLRNFGALLRLGATLQVSQRLAALEEQALQLIMEVIPADKGAILLTGSRGWIGIPDCEPERRRARPRWPDSAFDQ